MSFAAFRSLEVAVDSCRNLQLVQKWTRLFPKSTRGRQFFFPHSQCEGAFKKKIEGQVSSQDVSSRADRPALEDEKKDPRRPRV